MAVRKVLAGFAVALGVAVLASVANAAPRCGQKACRDEVAASGLNGLAMAVCLKSVISDCRAGSCSCTGGSPPCSCVCGDGLCGPSEDCGMCPQDCGACCGNGTCEPGQGEDCGTCPQDCRFVDNGDGTVSDCQTGLMWEKKVWNGGLHNVNFFYSWAGICPDFSLCQPSAGAAAACAAGAVGTTGCAECASGTCNVNPFGFDGVDTTIWDWLATVNAEGGTGFAGHSDWRIPEVNRDGGSAELETILAAPCSSSPCVGPAFNRCTYDDCSVLTCSCTTASVHWSSVTSGGDPERAWGVYFGSGGFLNGNKGLPGPVRAVRGGS